jgi:hypothetical protein
MDRLSLSLCCRETAEPGQIDSVRADVPPKLPGVEFFFGLCARPASLCADGHADLMFAERDFNDHCAIQSTGNAGENYFYTVDGYFCKN